MSTKDNKWYFVYTTGANSYINTCVGVKELSVFLNRQEWRVKKDLLASKRKKKLENKIIKDKNGNEYTILSEEEFKKYMTIERKEERI